MAETNQSTEKKQSRAAAAAAEIAARMKATRFVSLHQAVRDLATHGIKRNAGHLRRVCHKWKESGIARRQAALGRMPFWVVNPDAVLQYFRELPPYKPAMQGAMAAPTAGEMAALAAPPGRAVGDDHHRRLRNHRSRYDVRPRVDGRLPIPPTMIAGKPSQALQRG